MFPLFEEFSFGAAQTEYRPGELAKILDFSSQQKIGVIKNNKSVKSLMASIKDKFKYVAKFNDIEIKAHTIKKGDEAVVALASVENLKPFLPNFDLEENYDLVFFSANAYNPNLPNRNNQVIGGLAGIEIAPSFINRFVNFEHSRANILGFITDYGFSEYGTDKPLTKDEAIELANKGKVFNVAISGILWKLANPDVVEAIEDNPLDASISWEIGFSDYSIAAGRGTLNDCQIINDPDEIEELKGCLKTFGGNGVDRAGRQLNLLISSEAKALGVGIVGQPAGYVKSLLLKTENDSMDQAITSNISDETIEESISTKPVNEEMQKIAASERGIEPAKLSVTDQGKLDLYIQEYNTTSDHYCQLLIPHILAGDSFDVATKKVNDYLSKVAGVVTETSQYIVKDEQDEDIKYPDTEPNLQASDNEKISQTVNTIITKNNTMLNPIKDLNDTNIKEVKASVINDLYSKDLADAAKDYVDQIKAEKEKVEKLEADLKAAKEAADTLTKKVEEIEAAQLAAKAEADFQNRMGYLNEEFELSDEARASILDDVKACADDDAFKKFVAKLSVFAAKKDKVKKEAKEGKFEKKDAEEVSEKEDEMDASEILASLKSDEPNIPNKETVTESTVELFARVFGDAVTIK